MFFVFFLEITMFLQDLYSVRIVTGKEKKVDIYLFKNATLRLQPLSFNLINTQWSDHYIYEYLTTG